MRPAGLRYRPLRSRPGVLFDTGPGTRGGPGSGGRTRPLGEDVFVVMRFSGPVLAWEQAGSLGPGTIDLGGVRPAEHAQVLKILARAQSGPLHGSEVFRGCEDVRAPKFRGEMSKFRACGARALEVTRRVFGAAGARDSRPQGPKTRNDVRYKVNSLPTIMVQGDRGSGASQRPPRLTWRSSKRKKKTNVTDGGKIEGGSLESCWIFWKSDKTGRKVEISPGRWTSGPEDLQAGRPYQCEHSDEEIFLIRALWRRQGGPAAETISWGWRRQGRRGAPHDGRERGKDGRRIRWRFPFFDPGPPRGCRAGRSFRS